METLCFSETLVSTCRSTRRYYSENQHRRYGKTVVNGELCTDLQGRGREPFEGSMEVHPSGETWEIMNSSVRIAITPVQIGNFTSGILVRASPIH
jgi:hypothetical protein